MYDTPQLLLKLRADGQNDNSAEVRDWLEAVGATNTKGCWSLRPEYLAEVDVNWSFYSETDKQLVKRFEFIHSHCVKFMMHCPVNCRSSL